MVTAVSTIAAAALLCGAVAAQAAERPQEGELRRNGQVSSRLFVPTATAAVAGEQVSAGLALGVRGPLRQHVGWAAPTLTVDLNRSSKLSILATPGRGAMVVLQTAAW